MNELIEGTRYYSDTTTTNSSNNMYLLKPVHNIEQRTIYFGNIPSNISVSDIIDQIKFGPIQAIRPLPEKNGLFITFIDSQIAYEFYQQINRQHGFQIYGNELKIGWGKPSNLTTNISNALQYGASRNVYLGLLDDTITEDDIRQDLLRFGHIENIKIISDKKIAFIHFLCISNAVKCVNTLQTETKWQSKRINFGKDRCQQQPLLQPPPQQFILPSYSITPTPYVMNDNTVQFAGVANRTIYLGNIHPDTTLEDICNSIRGGILSQIRFIPDKHIAFITFVDPMLAENFINTTECLVIKNRRLKLGWGKPSSLPITVLNAIQNGGSRNVYIGNIDDQITEEKLKHDFSEYGDIELVNTLKEKNCAFVNFTSIAGAVRAIDGIRSKEEYKKFRINYGKDRCGNPPRFTATTNHHHRHYEEEEEEQQEDYLMLNNSTITTTATTNNNNNTTNTNHNNHSTAKIIITNSSSSSVVIKD